MKSIVSVKNLSRSFSSGGKSLKALDSVDLNISKGEIFGLLGPNGAGKTTLISILCGFLIPDQGSAKIFGLDCKTDSKKIAKKMNLASGFSGISDFFSAEELLRFFCYLYGLDNIENRIENALKITGLLEHRKRRPADFSSGLGRRFLIAKAILNDPEVLLLDEPTVGLDVESAVSLRKHIKAMKKNGTTILLTTHNMPEAQSLCDRIALIKGGKIIACGTFEELREQYFPRTVLQVRCKYPKKVQKVLSKNKSVAKVKPSNGSIKVYLNSEEDLDGIFKLVASSGAKISNMDLLEVELEELYSKIMD